MKLPVVRVMIQGRHHQIGIGCQRDLEQRRCLTEQKSELIRIGDDRGPNRRQTDQISGKIRTRIGRLR